MSTYTNFFLSGSRASVQLDLIEIYHPNFSKVFRHVRNARKGVTVTLEDSSTGVFTYMPMSVKAKTSKDDLDNAITISFGDLGEVIPKELDRVRNAGGFKIMPTVTYRVYDSANLASPLYGPVRFVIKTFSFKREGATFEAKAPGLNNSATGILYRLDAFPMLRGAL